MSVNPNSSQRMETIAYLTTNCDCWKGEEKYLSSLSDEKLSLFKKQIEGDKKKTEELTVVTATLNKATAPFQHSHYVYRFDAETGKHVVKSRIPDAEIVNGGTMNPVVNQTQPTAVTQATQPNATTQPPVATPVVAATTQPTNGQPTVTVNSSKPLSAQEWLAMAPPEMQVVWNHAQTMVNQERSKLVAQLTEIANHPLQEPSRKTLILNKVQSTSDVEILRDLLTLVGPIPVQQQQPYSQSPMSLLSSLTPAPNFVGAAGANPTTAVTNQQGVDDEDILPIPTSSWRMAN